jgi:hypothetical protein
MPPAVTEQRKTKDMARRQEKTEDLGSFAFLAILHCLSCLDRISSRSETPAAFPSPARGFFAPWAKVGSRMAGPSRLQSLERLPAQARGRLKKARFTDNGPSNTNSGARRAASASVVHHSDAILLSFFGRPSVDSRDCGVALILNPAGVVSRSPGCNPGKAGFPLPSPERAVCPTFQRPGSLPSHTYRSSSSTLLLLQEPAAGTEAWRALLYSPFRAGDAVTSVPRAALRLPWASGYNPCGV